MAVAALKNDTLSPDRQVLFDYAVMLGDTALIHGQRLSEWTSHAPTVELDIALGNQALDLIGQARMFLEYAGKVEEAGRDEDALAFLRDGFDFRNLLIVELPNGDFGHTMARQFIMGVYSSLLYEALSASQDDQLAGIAKKAVKEQRYHARHGGEWLVRLGDGTEESHARAQRGLDELWPYTHELFTTDPVESAAAELGFGVDPSGLRAEWDGLVDDVLARAGLSRPEDDWQPDGGKRGEHTENLGYILAELQFLQRAYPGAEW